MPVTAVPGKGGEASGGRFLPQSPCLRPGLLQSGPPCGLLLVDPPWGLLGPSRTGFLLGRIIEKGREFTEAPKVPCQPLLLIHLLRIFSPCLQEFPKVIS